MKRIICILMIAVMAMTVVSSLADPTVVDGVTPRNITITKAGENTVEDGISPTTGRTLSEVEVPENFPAGMAKNGEYLPILVQITNAESGIGYRAPWYANYADIIYETPLEREGVTRMTMLFSDTLPDWVGCTRSIRCPHVWIREEWNAPYVYWGHQEYPNVHDEIRAMSDEYRIPDSSNKEKVSLFYDGIYDQKPWGKYRYRVEGFKNPNNGVYNLAELLENVVAEQEFTPRNHTFLFSDTLPEGGDEGGTVYVTFNKNHASDGQYYFNTMLQYEPDDGVYYRWILRDLTNTDNSTLYEEMAPTNIKMGKNNEEGKYIKCDATHGNPVAISNVIIQHVDMTWFDGNRRSPYPTLIGTGNADIFMGGKHYSGVWNRDTYQDRTVFYGEDGQEIALQRGKTMIIMLDSANELRELKYE